MIEHRYIDLKHELFDIYYEKLNDMQRESVYSVNGPNLILAGAGSGKTTVLVNRITHIIRYGNGYAVNFIPASRRARQISRKIFIRCAESVVGDGNNLH